MKKKNQTNTFVRLLVILIVIKLTIALVIFTIPLVQPDVTIQCVSAPCLTPDITIYEWFMQR